MKDSIASTLLFLFYLTLCNGQTIAKRKNNALSLEIGKTGLIYNLSFDHKFQEKNFGIRIGVGSNFAKYLQAFSTGGGGYYLFGHKKNYFELGIDIKYLTVDEISDDQKEFVFINPDYSIKTYYGSMNIGFRKYGNIGLFRIGVSPGFIKNGFIPGAYISYGLTF